MSYLQPTEADQVFQVHRDGSPLVGGKPQQDNCLPLWARRRRRSTHHSCTQSCLCMFLLKLSRTAPRGENEDLILNWPQSSTSGIKCIVASRTSMSHDKCPDPGLRERSPRRSSIISSEACSDVVQSPYRTPTHRCYNCSWRNSQRLDQLVFNLFLF